MRVRIFEHAPCQSHIGNHRGALQMLGHMACTMSGLMNRVAGARSVPIFVVQKEGRRPSD